MLEDAPTIELRRGDTKVFRFTASEDGEPIDLTDYNLYFAARSEYPAGSVSADTDAEIVKDWDGNGIDIIDAAEGIFEISFATVDTKALEISNGVLDLYYGIEADIAPIGFGDAQRLNLGQGRMVVYADVVRT